MEIVMVEHVNVETVGAMVGDVVVEEGARDWVYALRMAAEGVPVGSDDVSVTPRITAWSRATADLVEALIDVEGGITGLLAAEDLGIDVHDALDRAIRLATDAVTMTPAL